MRRRCALTVNGRVASLAAMSLVTSGALMAFAAGIAAGAIHVMSGPDHLAAVAPLSLSRGRRSWVVGLRWGLGHASGVLLVGAALLVLRHAIDLSAISGWGERVVGAVLVAVGAWGLWRAASRRVHVHPHSHEPGGAVHVHVHVHAKGSAREHEYEHANAQAHAHALAHGHQRPLSAGQPHRHGHAPFWIGTLHGLAGSAHVLGILPALALPSRTLGALYLSGFGAGTVVAMMAFSLGVGVAAERLASLARGGERAYRILLGSASAAAVLVGAFWFARA